MKFKLKHYLSYLFDILLENKSSAYNPSLKLYLSSGQLKLTTQGAVYSYGNLYDNFRRSFEILEIGKRKINSVLILGLGTGSIVQILENKFQITASYDIVEIDSVVAELFNKYKNNFIQSNAKININDALQFMQINQIKYDLVCMDIFCDRKVPEIFESDAFLQDLKNSIAANGILLYNRLAIDDNDKKLNDQFTTKMKMVFPELSIIKMKYNWMYVNSN